MAVKYSNQPVVLIVNQKNLNSFSVEGCKFVSVESFYNSDNFDSAKRNLDANIRFRNSLWLKSLERFFVLYQYMETTKAKYVFHAELDQFLFDTKGLVEKLIKLNRLGIFSTCHSNETVIASVFFCNSLDIFKSFLDFASSGVSFKNEMELLASWAKVSEEFFEIPNADAFVHNRSISHIVESELLSIEVTGGIVDSAELGQWFGGIDPRNVPINHYPRNRFVGPISNINLLESELTQLRFDFQPIERRLFLTVPGERRKQIYNLHIHSKIHSKSFLREEYLLGIISRVNFENSFRFKWTRSRQLADFVLSYTAIIIRRLFRQFNLKV
jgi:hypothetical protein